MVKQMLQVSNKKPFKTIFFGVGGTGSNTLSFVSQLYKNTSNSIILIDGDRIEKKNYENQRFPANCEGRFKSEVLCEQYKRIYPKLNIACKSKYVEEKDKEELIKIILGTDTFPILLGCVDNNVTRKLLHSIFHDDRVKDIIYIDSGNGTEVRTGQVLVGYKSGGVILSPCAADVNPEILEDEDQIVNTNSCSQITIEKPQNISTNILAAASIFCIVTNITSFGYIENNSHRFSAENVSIISRQVTVE